MRWWCVMLFALPYLGKLGDMMSNGSNFRSPFEKSFQIAGLFLPLAAHGGGRTLTAAALLLLVAEADEEAVVN